MTTKGIIENKLGFLIKEFGFDFVFNNISGDHYIFRNKNGYIEFYEWEQFGESSIVVKYGQISRIVHLFEEYPKVVGQFNQTHKGIKWFFKDKRNDYWEMISQIIRIEINNKKSIFGLNI